MRIGRIVVGLTLAAAASTTVLSTANASAAGKGDFRDRWAAAAAAQGNHLSALQVTAQAGGCFTDSTGDTTPSSSARADLTAFCAQHDGPRVSFSAQLAEVTNPDTDPAWDGMTGVGWGIDVNGDGESDFDAVLMKDELALFDANGMLRCDGTPVISAEGYSASFTASCIGGAASFRVQAYSSYDSDPADLDAPVYEDVTAWAGPVVADGTATVLPTSRLSGADRYTTAVAISKRAFPTGAPVVYLARADGYADALAGGALTDGPVLLVPRCGTVPAPVLAEVRRLVPSQVIALGGANAVCDTVLAQVARS